MFELANDSHRTHAVPSWLAADLGVSPHAPLGAGVPAAGPATRRPRWLPRRRVDRDVAHLPLFDGLSKRELRVVWRLSEGVEAPAGAALPRPGRAGSQLVIVLDGEVDVVHDGEVVSTCGPGSPLGELASLDRGATSATLRARTPVAARLVDEPSFAKMLVGVPELQERMEALADDVRAA